MTQEKNDSIGETVQATPPATSLTTDQVNPAVPLLVLNRQQAAHALGISTRLLDDLARGHRLPSVKLGGRVVFPVSMLNEFLAEQCRKGRRR